MDDRSKYLRRLVIRGLKGGGRGHIGSSMSLIEILRVLYDDILNVDPSNPRGEKRDRLILSKGHGCLALYALLSDLGFIDARELDNFCGAESRLGGHPELWKIPGVEASTGALGHGMSIAVGMALSAKIKKQGQSIFVIMGDGEINEGSVWEAALSANKHRLDNLCAVIDCNKIQSYGNTSEVLDLEPLGDKWRAFGFHVEEVDGHNIEELISKFKIFLNNKDRPTVIICHTIKGKGVHFAEGRPEWHHKSGLSDDEILNLEKCLE